MREQLIVFTRYPEPGQTKTRLIPALGAVAAADLQRQMTEHLLAQVQPLQMESSCAVEIRFAGGTLGQMRQWLGDDWGYAPQGEGDLGDRMAAAVQAACQRGATQVVIVGTDCPDVDAALVRDAFAALQTHDVVLGPALDGGYYLIGLRQEQPALFRRIAWSTPAVLPTTVAIARQHNLAIAFLPTLSDVDHPADLPIWERVQQGRLASLEQSH